jgi:hypothetical protein
MRACRFLSLPFPEPAVFLFLERHTNSSGKAVDANNDDD